MVFEQCIRYTGLAVGLMVFEKLIRYIGLAVGLKPSARGCETRLRRLERMMYSKTIILHHNIHRRRHVPHEPGIGPIKGERDPAGHIAAIGAANPLDGSDRSAELFVGEGVQFDSGRLARGDAGDVDFGQVSGLHNPGGSVPQEGDRQTGDDGFAGLEVEAQQRCCKRGAQFVELQGGSGGGRVRGCGGETRLGGRYMFGVEILPVAPGLVFAGGFEGGDGIEQSDLFLGQQVLVGGDSAQSTSVGFSQGFRLAVEVVQERRADGVGQ